MPPGIESHEVPTQGKGSRQRLCSISLVPGEPRKMRRSHCGEKVGRESQMCQQTLGVISKPSKEQEIDWL